MSTAEAVTSALAALGISGAASLAASVSDGRALLVGQHDSLARAALARVGSDFGMLALPQGHAGVRAAHALVREALLPMADDFAVAPRQRDEARKALIAAIVALEQLVKGRTVRVPPAVLQLHPRIQNFVDVHVRDGLSRVPCVDDVDTDVAEDLQTLNELQAQVGRWNTEIDRIITASRNGPETLLSAEEEQLFWSSVDAAFENVQVALASPAVVITLQLLARKRRATGFLTDASQAVGEGRRHAQGILNLLKGLPVAPLRTADDLPSLISAVKAMLSHVTAKIRLSSLPVNRALSLVSSLSADVTSSLCRIITRNGGLLRLQYKLFQLTERSCSDLFEAWNDGVDHCRRVALERAAARNESLSAREPPAFAPLEHRIREIAAFRHEHEAMLLAISKLQEASDEPLVSRVSQMLETGVGDSTAISVNAAFDQVIDLCDGPALVDVTVDGDSTWANSLGTYAESVRSVEDILTSAFTLTVGSGSSLATKASAAEHFASIIDRSSFAQPIASLIPELVILARKEIAEVRTKASCPIEPAECYSGQAFCDEFPPVSKQVMQLRHLSGTIDSVIEYLFQIVGPSRAEADLDLRDIIDDCRSLQNRALDPSSIVREWSSSVSLTTLQEPASLFQAARTPDGAQTLRLSLAPRVVQVSKEMRCLQELGFSDLDNSVKVVADLVHTLHAVYAALLEAVHAYSTGISELESLQRGSSGISSPFTRVVRLVRSKRRVVRDLFTRGISKQWTDPLAELELYAEELLSEAKLFFCAVVLVKDRDRSILESVGIMDSCWFRYGPGGLAEDDINRLHQSLRQIQSCVGDMRLSDALTGVSSYALEIVIPMVERAIGTVLSHIVTGWTRACRSRVLGIPVVTMAFDSKLGITTTSPELEDVEVFCGRNLFDNLEAVCFIGSGSSCELRNARLDEYEQNQESTHLFSLFCRAKLYREGLVHAVDCIRSIVEDGNFHLAEWREFDLIMSQARAQFLENRASAIAAVQDCPSSQAGCDSQHQLAVVTGQFLYIVNAQAKIFSTAGGRPQFQNDGLTIDRSHVLQSLTSRLDEWLVDVAAQCARLVECESQSVYKQCIESLALVKEMTGVDAMDSVVLLRSVGTIIDECHARSSLLSQAQNLLMKPGIAAPENTWIELSSISNVMKSLIQVHSQRMQTLLEQRSSFEGIFKRRRLELDADLAGLFAEIDEYKHRVEPDRSNRRTENCGEEYCSGAEIELEQAAVDIANVESRLEQLTLACERLRVVAIVMDFSDYDRHSELETIVADLRDINLAVSATRAVQVDFDAIAGTPFLAHEPKAIKCRLEDLLRRLDEVSDARGGFTPATLLENKLLEILRYHSVIASLRSVKLSAMRQREVVETLFSRTGAKEGFGEITLQDLWNCGLSKHGSYLQSIFDSAAEEFALSQFLASIAEVWTTRRVEFISRGRVHLLRGIPALVDEASEHLQALNAMSGSACARLFESERLAWEARISRLMDVMELWADVQTKWLHLSNLFSGSGPGTMSLKKQLRQEYASFVAVQDRLAELTARAKSAPGILEALEDISGLDRMSIELTGIVRSLSKFLETQRTSFPRYFFLPDDDLLYVLSIDITSYQNLACHLQKMFPGVSGFGDVQKIMTGQTASVKVVSIVSKEGERLDLFRPVIWSAASHVTTWLRALEVEIKSTLEHLLPRAVRDVSCLFYSLDDSMQRDGDSVAQIITKYPAQILILAFKISFSLLTENALGCKGENLERTTSFSLKTLIQEVDKSLASIAEARPRPYKYLGPRETSRSTDKAEMTYAAHRTTCSSACCEQLTKELVYQREVLTEMNQHSTSDPTDTRWCGQLRFYMTEKENTATLQVEAKIADASISYGWEYLGIGESLVQTPLTCRCFLTLAQALRSGLGCSPFGPAGTGKTETVKALGRLLGRSVAVFNCDETFDAISVGRILAGVCRTGSWVCFDEFNRLSSGILSSTSNQLAFIQGAVQKDEHIIPNFYGGSEPVRVASGIGIFVTMNPSYRGRRELPTNLASLFRPLAMTKPDSKIICEVSLRAQGFTHAGSLSGKLVSFFDGLSRLLPQRSHYDFGLRSLKHAIAGAGALLNAEETATCDEEVQTECIVSALLEAIKPRLIVEDVRDFLVFVETLFPSISARNLGLSAELLASLRLEAEESYVELNDQLLEKVAELYRTLLHRPAVMLLGPSGCGKTTAWRLLYNAMRQMSDASSSRNSKHFSVRVIDPKLLTASQLFGSMDLTTREWSDGIFTHVLRELQEHIMYDEVSIAAPGKPATTTGIAETKPTRVMQAHHWIVFDGDVDPDWAENLNSVLDDNRTLTLPNGERIPLPGSVRILFEAEHVRYANPSTVSRCGMICFSSRVSLYPIARKHVLRLRKADPFRARSADNIDSLLPVVTKAGAALHGFDSRIMEILESGCLLSLFSSFDSLLTRFVALHGEAVENGSVAHLEKLYVQRSFLVSACRGICGSASREDQAHFSSMLFEALVSSGIEDESLTRRRPSRSLCDVTVDPSTAEYMSYAAMVEDTSSLHIDPARVGDPSVVIPTAATLEHAYVLADFIRSSIDTMVVLCGPPGCGKSMIVVDALSSMPDVDVAAMSFSAATSAADVLASIKTHAEMYKLPNGGLCLRPKSRGSKLVLFCDEVNLGRPDKYGTQTAVCFLRQLIEQKGFWNITSPDWIAVDGLRVVAACNPPELVGRQTLPSRLLRYSHVIRAELPAGDDLVRIYSALTSSLLRGISVHFEKNAGGMTAAMIQLYESNRAKFAPSSGPLHPHYVYSPRDISRWLRGMSDILMDQQRNTTETENNEDLPLTDIFQGALASTEEGFQCTWPDVLNAFAHEARRLFKDRLVSTDERSLFEELLASSMSSHLSLASSVVPDIWYSSWLSKRSRTLNSRRRFCPVEDVENLRKLVYRKLRSFCDEEGLGGAWMSGSGAGAAGDSMIDQFAVTNDVLKHLARIERVLRLPIGHALLVGAPGSGKKTLARFAAWMEGMSVHQIRSHAEYSTENFADDLRNVLRLAGVAGDPIVLIFDESNALEGDYLEMMNAILACGDVPGLFEGENRSTLLNSLRKHISDGSLATDETLYKRFIERVQQNLHVVFTLSCDLASRRFLAARSQRELVAEELNVSCEVAEDLSLGLHAPGSELLTRSPALYNRCIVNWIGDWDEETLTAVADLKLEVSRGKERTQIVESAVEVHLIARDALATCTGNDGRVTPRHYLEFVEQLNRITLEKGDDIQESAKRLQNGLGRLRGAGVAVDELKETLREKADSLAAKETEANRTLSAMAKEQGLAERAKVDAESLAMAAERAADAASRRQELVSEQLAKVEPKVEAARQAVGSIRKENLEELRAMPNPPPGVKLAIEGVMTLLDCASGRRGLQPSWSVMRSRMRGPEFISSVLNFDPDAIPSDLLAQFEARLVRNPDFDVDRIYYSSRAAGPLAEWALASLDYAAVCKSVAPLRVEVADLDGERKKLLYEKEKAESSIAGLEERITKCRDEFAILVSQAESIRHEMDEARRTLVSAEQMLESLADEWDRWRSELADLNSSADFVWGNAIVGAAFIAYAGPLDEAGRQSLLKRLKKAVALNGIAVDDNLQMTEYLTSVKERVIWTQAGLAMDENSVENYSILTRSARYPLIIDPSRCMEPVVQALVASSRPHSDHLSADHQESSTSARIGQAARNAVVVSKTSFAQTGKNSYLRVMESAMRFGTAVLLNDAELFDHSISAVLGQEATTGDASDTHSVDSGVTGGSAGGSVRGYSHRLVRLGDRDVDQSPSFRLFLCAADINRVPTAAVSRSCVVSFRMSPANLKRHCLSRALQVLVPDLETRRSELTKARLAYEQRKLRLESDLLLTISNSTKSSSSLLDGSLLSTLQALKAESNEMMMKMQKRERLMQEVDAKTQLYNLLGCSGVAIYFALSRLSHLNPLYRFSVDRFLTMFDACIRDTKTERSGSETEVVREIRDRLFKSVYVAVGPSLFPFDRIPFAVTLVVVAANDNLDDDSYAERNELLDQILIVASSATTPDAVVEQLSGMLPKTDDLAVRLESPDLSNWGVRSTIELLAGLAYYKVAYPQIVGRFLELLASRLPGGGSALVHDVNAKPELALKIEIEKYKRLGLTLKGSGSTDADSRQNGRTQPLMLCSRGSGVNPSALVVQMAQSSCVAYESIAMGDAETLLRTSAAIELATRRSKMGGNESGIMLILKNMHLAPEDCCQVVLQEIARNKGLLPYLLVLTCEVPEGTSRSSVVDMAEHCRVLAFQAECNFRSTLSRCATICHETNLTSKGGLGECLDEDRSLGLAAVAWLHSSLLERCTYSPLSFSKRYSFSDADLAAARDTVISLFSESIVDGLTFSPGVAITRYDADNRFQLLEHLLTHAIYGGRVETNSDFRLLETIVAQLMDAIRRHRTSRSTIRVVDLDETGVDVDDLAADHSKIVELPTAFDELMRSIGTLPLSAPAAWFGLGREAERESRSRLGVLAVDAATRIHLGRRRRLGSAALVFSRSNVSDKVTALANSHPCYAKLENFMRLLPSLAVVGELEKKVFEEGSPAGRFRAQESRLLVGLFRQISTDVGHALEVLSRRRRVTERVSNVISALGSGAMSMPGVWSVLQPHGVNLAADELACTITHGVHTMLTTANAEDKLDLRATLRPTGLLSALMLSYCKCNTGVTPDALELRLHVLRPLGGDAQDVPSAMQGVAGVGLGWDESVGVFKPTHSVSRPAPLPPCTLRWEARSSHTGGSGGSSNDAAGLRTLPLQWHGRTIADVRVPCAPLPEMQWLQCGAALVIEGAPRPSPPGAVPAQDL